MVHAGGACSPCSHCGCGRSLSPSANTLKGVPLDLGNISALNRNAHGSVSLYADPKPPAGHEANWISTVAGKGRFPFFRRYGQEWPRFETAWKLLDFGNVK